MYDFTFLRPPPGSGPSGAAFEGRRGRGAAGLSPIPRCEAPPLRPAKGVGARLGRPRRRGNEGCGDRYEGPGARARAQVRCALCLFLPSVPAAAPPRPRTPPTFKNHLLRGFPGGPVVKTPRFPCRGRRFDP